MLRTILSGVLAAALLALPIAAPAQVVTGVQAPDHVIWHSGGCRKSSPPGQCCHAGSKPLHCH